MMHVAITGAAGFIGWNTVREALRRGWRVDAWVHRARHPELEALAARGAVRVRQADLAEPAAVREAFDVGDRPDAVIHCAGRASDVGWSRAFRCANYESVVNLGRYCETAGVKRFVFVSTTDVYGLRDFHGEREDELPYGAPARNPYPRFKILAEQWLRAHLPPERYAILRPAAVWGEGDPTLTPRFRAFLASSPYIIHFGRWQGRNRWPLADVRTVAAANCLAAARPEAAGLAINVLDSAHTTLESFYRQLAARYFPDRHYRTITLPYALGAAFGSTVSTISTLCNLAHPFTDPSLYALRSISHNLDFSNARLRDLFRQAGEPLPDDRADNRPA
jgi:nucleoside-diphosphate-sugar epimerase